MRLLTRESETAAAGDTINFTYKNTESKPQVINAIQLTTETASLPATNYPSKFYIEKYTIDGKSFVIDVVFSSYQALHYTKPIFLEPHEQIGVRVIDRGALKWYMELWSE